MFDEYIYDFGRDNRQVPQRIIKPKTTSDILEVFTSFPHSKIAIRGKGHSTGGQALANDGVVIDMKSYCAIGEITINKKGENIMEVQAGALMKDVFKICLAQGLTPPTYADWLDLTVGGPISTGGVGQCSFKKGLQIDNIDSLEIVTAGGEIIICSAENNKNLFDLARGGLGHFGIISRVWMRLEKAPENVFVYKLLYSDLASFLYAQLFLADHDEIDAIQSHIILNEKEELSRRIGSPISNELYDALPKQPQYFLLEITKYANSTCTLQSFQELLILLTHHNTELIFGHESKFEDHVNRIPPLLANLLEKSFPKHHHCCFFIAANKASQLLEMVFSNPAHCNAMGRGNILVIPIKRSKIKSPYFMLPDAENIFFIGILRRHVEPCLFDVLIQINEETYQQAEKFGGKIYPVGSGSYLTNPSYWQRHYGNDFEAIIEGKKRYDPKYCLTPNIKLLENNIALENND